MRDTTHAAAHPLRVLLALMPSLALAACAAPREQAPGRAEAPIAAADFANPSISRTPEAPTPPPTIPMEKASAGVGDIKVSVVAPDVHATMPKAPTGSEEQTFVVDQMVGQINGKPIYADEFFKTMDARLRQEAARLPLQKWVAQVKKDVGGALWDEVRDQLYLSEFQTSLTQEQRMGVRAFIEDLRHNIQRSYGGSSEVANEKLQQQEGVTLRQKVQNEADQEFIRAQLRSSIAQRIQVSFKDIQLYYQQNYDRFHPVPVAVFRVIRVPLSSTKRVDEVESRLASGESPVDVAADLSDWATDDHNMYRIKIGEGGFAKTTFWGAEALNTATQALKPGQITPRIDVGSRAWWIYLDDIDAPPSQTLYEAQVEIEQEIQNARFAQEQQRYLKSLMSKANMTRFDEMVKRLVAYAVERYYVRRIYQGEEIKVDEN